MKIIRRLLQGVSLTAAMFVFQACYGTPHDFDYYEDNNLVLRVVDGDNGEAMGDVKVYHQMLDSNGNAVNDWNYLGRTNADGYFPVWTLADGLNSDKFRFEAEDQPYAVLDTVLSQIDTDTVQIALQRADDAQ